MHDAEMDVTAQHSQGFILRQQASSSHRLLLIALLLLVSSYSSIFGGAAAFHINTPARHNFFPSRVAKKIRHLQLLSYKYKIQRREKVVSSKSSLLSSTMVSTSNNDAASANKSPSPLKHPFVRALLVFSIGYGLGGASAPGWQRHSHVTTKVEATRIALTVLILREAWRLTPPWIKPRIKRFVRGLFYVLTAPLRRYKGADGSKENNEEEAAAFTAKGSEDDITDLSNFVAKVQRVLSAARTKLEAEEHLNSEEKGGGYNRTSDLNVSFLAYLQMLWQIKSRRANSRDELYRGAGEREIPKELLEGADEMFELADLAYNEHESGEDIKVVLKGMGYDLIKHDTTTPVPGYLGHYIAISNDGSSEEDNTSSSLEKKEKRKEKIAIIGCKGTSTFEDFLTDMCANSVEYTLEHPFYEGGSNTIRCHEGVYISSQRLVADLLPLVKNLLIPSGYKIVIVGHSLGAGCAAIVSLLLRASIPSLQDSDKLKVWAFASPPVLDLDSSRGCSSFVTTVVNNCDVIPRANIGPFVVTVRLLRAVNKRLKERNLGVTDLLLKDWMKKSHEDLKEEEMLMSVEEIVSTIADAIARGDDHDPDHLYVPGKVLLLYDLWEKEQLKQEEERRKESTKDYATILKEWVQHLKEADTLRSIDEVDGKIIPMAEEAILSDGTCKVLRLIEFDGRLIDDHLAPAYRSSIANILSSMSNTTVGIDTGT